MQNEQIPLQNLALIHDPIKQELQRAIEDVVSSQCFMLGPKLEDFEAKYAAMCNTTYCVGVGNGTDALTMILWLLGINGDHEVIVPSYTFISTVHAIRAAGAKPVFVDVEPKTLTIDPGSIEQLRTDKTKAIVGVDLFGHPFNYEALSEIAKICNIKLIEDASQAHGSTFRGKPCGSLGFAAAHSFYPTNNLGAFGDAGAVTTNDAQLYKALLEGRNLGIKANGLCGSFGVNSKLDEMQASVLLTKLKHLKAWNYERTQVAKWYYDGLVKLPGRLALPMAVDKCTVNWHQFVVKALHRDRLRAYLKDCGIDTAIHYLPAHMHKAYALKNDPSMSEPLMVTEAAARTCLSLPIYPGLTRENVTFITDRINDFYTMICRGLDDVKLDEQ